MSRARRSTDIASLIAAADAGLVAELARVAAQVDTEVAALTATLERFAALESRLQRTAERTGQQIDDEEWSRLVDSLGVSSVRPLLERLAHAHPDALPAAR